ncbi:hypothetical protein [Neobacillus sp. 114]|uniref:hypothetical protein n=1 Tax=Neobacillus sp. 114 TaxID=3048535 RepID=UPI0024C32FB8|nr:hypothetical protein [Neobacillus sp. 114]
MMNTKVKKGVLWGVIIAAMVFVVNVHHYLFGGASAMAGMNPQGGFRYPPYF